MVVGTELWCAVAEAVDCTRVAQKASAVAADKFRSPNVRLLLGSDACVEHTDNGIRFVTGLLRNVQHFYTPCCECGINVCDSLTILC